MASPFTLSDLERVFQPGFQRGSAEKSISLGDQKTPTALRDEPPLSSQDEHPNRVPFPKGTWCPQT